MDRLEGRLPEKVYEPSYGTQLEPICSLCRPRNATSRVPGRRDGDVIRRVLEAKSSGQEKSQVLGQI
jgi:hypothetical protein